MQTELTPRQRRRQAKLANMKETALDLVIEAGLDEFSMHKLAARLDLTPGALYRYFDSVDQLLMAIQIDVLEEFDSYLVAVLDTVASDNAVERIVTLCKAYMALDEFRPERFKLIGRFVSNPEPLFEDDAVKEGMEPTLRLLGRLAQSIEEAQSKGLIEDGAALDRAILLWSSIQGLIERQKLSRIDADVFDVDRLSDQLISTFLKGWGANHGAVEAAMEAYPTTDKFKQALSH